LNEYCDAYSSCLEGEDGVVVEFCENADFVLKLCAIFDILLDNDLACPVRLALLLKTPPHLTECAPKVMSVRNVTGK